MGMIYIIFEGVYESRRIVFASLDKERAYSIYKDLASEYPLSLDPGHRDSGDFIKKNIKDVLGGAYICLVEQPENKLTR